MNCANIRTWRSWIELELRIKSIVIVTFRLSSSIMIYFILFESKVLSHYFKHLINFPSKTQTLGGHCHDKSLGWSKNGLSLWLHIDRHSAAQRAWMRQRERRWGGSCRAARTGLCLRYCHRVLNTSCTSGRSGTLFLQESDLPFLKWLKAASWIAWWWKPTYQGHRVGWWIQTWSTCCSTIALGGIWCVGHCPQSSRQEGNPSAT